jgi:hypothetical protein
LLIANFCQALQNNSTGFGFPINTSDIAMQFERDVDLEQVLYQLNIQNVRLTQEYECLSKEVGAEVEEKKVAETNANSNSIKCKDDNIRNSKELEYRNNVEIEVSKCNEDSSDEAAKLRQHTNRMETRISILVDHNKQLDAQLKRLRQLVQLPDDPSGGSKFGTLRSKVVRATSLQSQEQEYDSGK